MEILKCPNCGQKIKKTKYCPYCGKLIEIEPKNKTLLYIGVVTGTLTVLNYNIVLGIITLVLATLYKGHNRVKALLQIIGCVFGLLFPIIIVLQIYH